MGKKAFTLIELVMIMVIIGILSVSGAWLMVYFVQDSIYIPNQLNTDLVANEALKIMIEGDSSTTGLRFSQGVTAIAANSITFIGTDQTGQPQSITYELDTTKNILYRSINGGADTQIPYYPGVNIFPKGGNTPLFTYYDATGNVTTTAANVKMIAINLIAQTGSGSFNNWQGQSTQSTCVTIGPPL